MLDEYRIFICDNCGRMFSHRPILVKKDRWIYRFESDKCKEKFLEKDEFDIPLSIRKLIKKHFCRGHFRPDPACYISFLVYLEKDGKIYVTGEDMLGTEHEKCRGYKYIFDLIRDGYNCVAIYSCREWWWYRRQYNPYGDKTDEHGRPFVEIYYTGYDELCNFIDGRQARLRYSYGNGGEYYIEHINYNWHFYEELRKKVAGKI